MDESIVEMIKSRDGKATLQIDSVEQTVSLVDESGNAGPPRSVKPLAQLYGPGTGLASVEFVDEQFMPLLIAIEEAIYDAYIAHPSLTDGAVLAALDRLCMTPEANVEHDPLAATIQFALRVSLCLSDFSREDVRHCLRKVKQSANRHNKLAGPRGYLEFIKKMLGQQAKNKL